MYIPKLKQTLGICVVIILAGCSKHEVHSSSGVGDNLSTSAIFKNSQEKSPCPFRPFISNIFFQQLL